MAFSMACFKAATASGVWATDAEAAKLAVPITAVAAMARARAPMLKIFRLMEAPCVNVSPKSPGAGG